MKNRKKKNENRGAKENFILLTLAKRIIYFRGVVGEELFLGEYKWKWNTSSCSALLALRSLHSLMFAGKQSFTRKNLLLGTGKKKAWNLSKPGCKNTIKVLPTTPSDSTFTGENVYFR